MNTEEIEEVKQKNAELFKKACVYTNLAYALVEAADTFMVDVQSLLRQVSADIDRSEKQKFKDAVTYGKYFNVRIKDLSRKLYSLDTSRFDALSDSDDLYELIRLITDRCGGQMQILHDIRDCIKSRFESKYGYVNE